MLQFRKNLIFVFLVIGLLFMTGCQQYFGETRGRDVGQQSGTVIPSYEPVLGRDLLQQLDANGNGEIDQEDFFAFSEAFGKTDTESLYKFDYDLDGDIDNDDYFIFSENFGKKIPKQENVGCSFGKECFLRGGDEKAFLDGKEIGVMKVGSEGDVLVWVDGQQVLINQGESKTIKGLKITVTKSFYDSCATVSCGGANVIIEINPIGGGGLNGDYNNNGCVDAKQDGSDLTGEDGKAFMKYYNDQRSMADLDGNGAVDIDDFFAFVDLAGKNPCIYLLPTNNTKNPDGLTLSGNIVIIDMYNKYPLLGVGDSVILDNAYSKQKIVTLVRVASNEDVLVSAGDPITVYSKTTIITNGIQIWNNNYFYTNNSNMSSAKLTIFGDNDLSLMYDVKLKIGDSVIVDNDFGQRIVTLIKVGSQGDILVSVTTPFTIMRGTNVNREGLIIGADKIFYDLNKARLNVYAGILTLTGS